MSHRKGFTLIEMLLVLLIIGVLIALLVPVLPQIISGSNAKNTRIFFAQLEVGLNDYNRIFNEYPPDIMAAENSWGGSGGPKSLLVALQGPAGQGWTTKQHGVNREFGPYFNSTRGRLHRDGDAFADAFGNRVMYHSARMDGRLSIGTSGFGQNTRYNARSCESFWAGSNVDDATNKMSNDSSSPLFYPIHWRKRLTQVTTSEGYVIPHNPTTYLLWSAGEDRRLGYLRYDQDKKILIFDLNGVCDDITNF